MISTILSWAAVGLLLVTSIGLLLSRDWRWSLGFLAAQYLAMFWLVALHWPFGLASVKLVTGWMASAALGVTRLGMSESDEPKRIRLAAGTPLPPVRGRHCSRARHCHHATSGNHHPRHQPPGHRGRTPAGWHGTLHLGITAEILRITLGLLTVLAGFETPVCHRRDLHPARGIAGHRQPRAGVGWRIPDDRLARAGSGEGAAGMNAPVLWIFLPSCTGWIFIPVPPRTFPCHSRRDKRSDSEPAGSSSFQLIPPC